MSKISEQIKTCRLLKRFSQEFVANRLGISQVAYRKYESGKTEITISRLYELAKIFDISVIELLGEDKPEIDYKDCPNCKRLETTIDNQNALIRMLQEKYEEKSRLKLVWINYLK